MGSAKKLQLVVYGIDSGDWAIMGPYLEAGELPNFAEVLRRASRAELLSTIPPITAVAWPTAFTGTNPGKHGLFSFFHLVQQRPKPISNADRKRPALWEILSEAGLRVGCFLVPFTYPADRVNGWMICGRGAGHRWDERSVWPPELYDDLQATLTAYPDHNYLVDTSVRANAEALLRAFGERVEWNAQLLDRLLSKHPVQVLVAVETITDIVQHKLLVSRRLAGEADMVLWAYKQADMVLGRILDHCGPETAFVLLSDHGAQPVSGYFDPAAWLCQAGFLRYRTASPAAVIRRVVLRIAHRAYRRFLRRPGKLSTVKRLERIGRALKFAHLIDWPRTRAFPWMSGGVIVNTGARSPRATVPDQERRRVAEEVKASFEGLVNPLTGARDVRAYLREELYEGPEVEEAPDVVLSPQDFALGLINTAPPLSYEKVFWSEEELREAGHAHLIVCEGNHRRQGILAIAPCSVDLPAQASLVDVTPTVLGMLDLPVPADMDGRPLLGGKVVGEAEAPSRARGRGVEYTAEEEEEIARRLANLGYI